MPSPQTRSGFVAYWRAKRRALTSTTANSSPSFGDGDGRSTLMMKICAGSIVYADIAIFQRPSLMAVTIQVTVSECSDDAPASDRPAVTRKAFAGHPQHRAAARHRTQRREGPHRVSPFGVDVAEAHA